MKRVQLPLVQVYLILKNSFITLEVPGKPIKLGNCLEWYEDWILIYKVSDMSVVLQGDEKIE